MAFIDKCTHMQRIAIISAYNGAIEAEGIVCEGWILFKNIDGFIYHDKFKKMEEWNAPYHTQLNEEEVGCCPEYVFVLIDDNDDTIVPRELSEDYEEIRDELTGENENEYYSSENV